MCVAKRTICYSLERMDLYSAAKRLNRPFVFTDEQSTRALTIADHGLIGDGFSAALVRTDGAIDWLCLPRFDSPSVFASLLDEENGGSTSVSPVDYPFESLQRYDPGTNVLETVFRIEGRGTIRLTDYMPWTDDPRSAMHEVHRRVQCVEGEAVVKVVFDPRFDYGRVEHDVRDRRALRAGQGRNRRASLGGSRRSRSLGTTTRRRRAGRLSPQGRRTRLGSSSAGTLPSPSRSWPIARSMRSARLGAAGVTGRNSSSTTALGDTTSFDPPLLLKLLMYAPTGAMVAAPTTSIPEWIGGVRNWDYRYTWTRDTAMAVRAANLLGCNREAREFFHFVRDTLERDRELHIMYAVDGGRVPDEHTLEHFAGYRGSKPVRIGNGARDQLQLDTAGALMDAAYVYERGGGSLTARGWRRLRGVVENVVAMWAEPDHGIWEPRAGKRHNVHSKLMSWLALRRGAELAPLFGDQSSRARWQQVADELHDELCARGLDSTGKRFVAAYEHEHPDASLLLLPIHGFLPPSDPRVLRTVEWIQASLGDGPYVYRYRTDDGVGGEEGAFVLCGFWLAEVVGDGRPDRRSAAGVRRARGGLEPLGSACGAKLSPERETLLGNFPQAFQSPRSHQRGGQDRLGAAASG